MSNLNEIQLKFNDTLVIRRFEKVDWKQIGLFFSFRQFICNSFNPNFISLTKASVNVEQLHAESDWEVIEKNLSNILCCHLESEFSLSNLDPNLCKLFCLAQIGIDYLLQCRHRISNELKIHQDQLETNQNVTFHH